MERDPRIGLVLQGRYRIVARIAQGGMGVVYRGERIGLERPVAIKFLQAVTDKPEIRRRFEVEARAASRLGHPNCVAVIDFGVDRETPYLVMDHALGRTLRAIIEEGPLAVTRALDLGRQILAGLAHAHEKGITYRDLKPENVLVSSDGIVEHARILDFGLAKLTGAASITDGVAVGTPSYMSPEQTIGAPADFRSDVYGAGILLFEMLTGKKPFWSEDPFETMQMHREAAVPAFAEIVPGRSIPAELEAVVRKALAKSPLDRYANAVQLAAALERAVAHHEIDALPPPTLVVQPRSTWLAFVAGLASATVLAAIAWIAFGHEPEPRVAAAPAPAPAPPAPAAKAAPAPEPEPAIEIDPATPADQIPGVNEAIALARAGQPAQAQAALEALSQKHKASAAVSYALGVVAATRGYWVAAVDAYGDALRLKPAYRTDPQLLHDVVHALASDKAAGEASALILRLVGNAALPALEEAVHDPDRDLSARAARLRNRIGH